MSISPCGAYLLPLMKHLYRQRGVGRIGTSMRDGAAPTAHPGIVQKMNKISITCILVLLLTGCGAKYTDTSNLNLTAGIGIKGVLEIGMTHSEVRQSTHDLVIHKFHWFPWEYEVPSLGISWQSGGVCSNDPLGIFVVYVGRCETNVISRFGGWLENTLAFTNGNLITEQQVQALFGEPEFKYDLSVPSPDHFPQAYHTVCATLRTNLHSSIVLFPGDGRHRLTYPDRGVFFDSMSNIVNAIGIGRPTHRVREPHR